MNYFLSIGSFVPVYIILLITYGYNIYNFDISNIGKFLIIVFVLGFIFIIVTIFTNYYVKKLWKKNSGHNERKWKNIKPNKKAYLDYMLIYFLPLIS